MISTGNQEMPAIVWYFCFHHNKSIICNHIIKLWMLTIQIAITWHCKPFHVKLSIWYYASSQSQGSSCDHSLSTASSQLKVFYPTHSSPYKPLAYCIQENVRPHYIFLSLSAVTKFKNGQIPMSQFISIPL